MDRKETTIISFGGDVLFILEKECVYSAERTESLNTNHQVNLLLQRVKLS